jgi:hypothetical protein
MNEHNSNTQLVVPLIVAIAYALNNTGGGTLFKPVFIARYGESQKSRTITSGITGML